MRQMFPLHLFKASFGTPLFLRTTCHWLLLASFCLAQVTQVSHAAPDIPVQSVVSSDFQFVHEALIEAIESEGLVISAVIPFGQMLERTAHDLNKPASPFVKVETIQFCSARLAWMLIEEDVTQAALCPLSITLLTTLAEPGKIILTFRSLGQSTAGRIQADKLLQKLVNRAKLESTQFSPAQ